MSLPNPNVTGPCEIQASPLCDGRGRERIDPMDMLNRATAFRPVMICQFCYERQALKLAVLGECGQRP